MILKTTFFRIFPLNTHGTYGNEKVLLLQAVSLQWFQPSYCFILCAAGSFCLWWKLLSWLTFWNGRETSLCSPQPIRLLLVWAREIWPCWRVGLPDYLCFFCCMLKITQNKWMIFCLTVFISGDINALRTILLYHFNNGIFIGGGLESGVTNLLKSLQGSNIRVMLVSI